MAIDKKSDLEALAQYFQILYTSSKDKSLILPYVDEEEEMRARKILLFRYNEANHSIMKKIAIKTLEKNIDGFNETFLINPGVSSKNFDISKFNKMLNKMHNELSYNLMFPKNKSPNIENSIDDGTIKCFDDLLEVIKQKYRLPDMDKENLITDDLHPNMRLVNLVNTAENSNSQNVIVCREEQNKPNYQQNENLHISM